MTETYRIYVYIYIYVNRRLEPTIFGNFPTTNVQTLYMYISIHIYIYLYIYISKNIDISIYLYIYCSFTSTCHVCAEFLALWGFAGASSGPASGHSSWRNEMSDTKLPKTFHVQQKAEAPSLHRQRSRHLEFVCGFQGICGVLLPALQQCTADACRQNTSPHGGTTPITERSVATGLENGLGHRFLGKCHELN